MAKSAMDIGEARKILKKYPNARYIVRCDSCTEVFYDVPLSEAAAMFEKVRKTGVVHVSYLKACRHWIEHPDHKITAYQRGDVTDRKFFCLTDDFLRQLPKQAKMVGVKLEGDVIPPKLKAAMLSELDDMEKRAIK